MNRSLILAGVLSLGVIAHQQARASSITTQSLGTLNGTVTTTGALQLQADVLEEQFTLSASSMFTAFTTSYATGGFQPNLILFDGAGNYVTGQEVTSPIAMADPTTGLALDGYLSDPTLAAGSYTLVLTDWLNQQAPTATNLSQGFTDNFGDGVNFIDVGGNTRTGNYSLTLSATGGAATPEPATAWLVLAPVCGAILLFRRRQALARAGRVS